MTAADDVLASLRARHRPDWYEKSRFGIFIHWGPFTIPAWAPVGPDPFTLAAEQGWDKAMSHTPYAEWYWNSISIEGSPAAIHHAETYGDADYATFVEAFQDTSKAFDPGSWADLFVAAGARYVVLTTKHHDGYLLWPSATPNPNRERWQSERDLVGELTDAVRERGLRMGLYYSGGLDWTFGGLPMVDFAGMLQAIPRGEPYASYIDAHWHELIDRYAPSVLWNDIHHPTGTDDAHRLFAEYYAAVPDGVVNDRFDVLGVRAGSSHADFTTPEFSTLHRISEQPWETCRGIGSGFGYNANEPDDQLLSAAGIVHLLADIVSKNGNLLLNVGPMADGTIPEAQSSRLRAVGAWLDVNGAAIYRTRPWTRFGDTTAAGDEVRFTVGEDGGLNAIVFAPAAGRVELTDVSQPSSVELLGHGAVEWTASGDGVVVDLPSIGDAPAYVLRIT